jgi:hypothetical protein
MPNSVGPSRLQRELGQWTTSPPNPPLTLSPTPRLHRAQPAWQVGAGGKRKSHPSHASKAVTVAARSPAAPQRAPQGPRARRANRGSRVNADRAGWARQPARSLVVEQPRSGSGQGPCRRSWSPAWALPGPGAERRGVGREPGARPPGCMLVSNLNPSNVAVDLRPTEE